jgi:hypothetical protein
MIRINFELKLNNPFNPNESCGTLLEFLNTANESVAHLSLAWTTNFWFAYYHPIKMKWMDYRFPVRFNSIQKKEPIKFSIIFNEFCIYFIQNNLINKLTFDFSFKYDNIEEFKDFKNQDESIKLSITNNDYCSEITYNNLIIEDKKEIGVDVVFTAYKGFDFINGCLNSFLMSYQKNYSENKFKINNFYFIDNNEDKDIKKSQNIFYEFSSKCESNFNCIYCKNKDKSYVKNRISGLNHGIRSAESEYILIFDSDCFFVNTLWKDEFDRYNEVKDLIGISLVNEPSTTKNIRHSASYLPRFNPLFFISKRDYLIEEINKDENVLGDFLLKTNYNNLEINICGFHFTKLYLNAMQDDKLFYVLPNNFTRSDDNMNNYTIEHINAGSFFGLQELKKYQSYRNKLNKRINSIKKYLDCGNIIDRDIVTYCHDYLKEIENNV